jgi:tetratricopeptide (TPR) repeat protein
VDRLDKFSALAIVGLILCTLLLIITQPANTDELRETQSAAVQRIDPALDHKVALAKTLLAANNIDQAEKLLAELIQAYPFASVPFFLNGDLRLYRQDPVGAMLEYRKAVDLNPDFLDKKSNLFQGKKVKKTVEEARAVIESGLLANDDDATLLAAKRVYYYMLRKIAGSCG